MDDKVKKISIYSDNMLEPPMFECEDAKKIVIRDSNGDPMIAIIKMANDTWGVSSSVDKDWNNVKSRFGI